MKTLTKVGMTYRVSEIAAGGVFSPDSPVAPILMRRHPDPRKLATLSGMEVEGREVDEQGRCAHYRGERDVVANRCAVCCLYWACHACHRELADHPFGRMRIDAPASVLCGNCGYTMGYQEYSAAPDCPNCDHPFNPGCGLHAPLYFEI